MLTNIKKYTECKLAEYVVSCVVCSGSYDKCIEHLRETHKSSMATVTQLVFAHTQVLKLNQIVIALLVSTTPSTSLLYIESSPQRFKNISVSCSSNGENKNFMQFFLLLTKNKWDM